MRTVEEALAAIPGRRDALDRVDQRLTHVIKYVERVLTELKIGVSADVRYTTTDGAFFLSFGKHGGRWTVLWSAEPDDAPVTPLVSAPRHVRAEVFELRDDYSLSPIERLIVETAESLMEIKDERSVALDTAMRLASVLEKAGFPDEGGQ